METMRQLTEITSRIEHLENSSEWIARETVHSDNAVSQTATLITVLIDDLRERILHLVTDLERGIERQKLN